jgi:glutamate-1-semialdehyde 2,1-aminomutase
MGAGDFMLMMNDSASLFARARQLFPGGVNSPVRAFRSVGGTPFFTTRASGAELLTADGRQFVDFVCTWGPAIHGHNHPAIRAALAEALQNGTSFGTPCKAEIQLAELITHFFPSIEKLRFCNSGTEATMTAVRLARGFTRREKLIKFAGCYHGHSDALLVAAGSGALTHGHPDSAGVTAGAAGDTIVLPFNDIGQVAAALDANAGQVAAVILEPHCGNTGLIKADSVFLQQLRQLTREQGAVLIFDEVMTGFRLAPGGVQELEGVVPDLTTLGKIIGGGLPVGAVGGRGEIMDYLAPSGPVYQAGTLSGNPLAMSAGIASLQLLQQQPPYEALEAAGGLLRDALLGVAKVKGLPLQVPQIGSLFSVFFTDGPVRNLDDARKTDTALYAKFFHAALDNGIYLPPSAFEACFISAAHGAAVMEKAVDGLTRALRGI